MSKRKFDTLLEAQWLPAASGAFEDRPPSPDRIRGTAAASPHGAGDPAFGGGLQGHLARGAVAVGGGATTATKAAGYRWAFWLFREHSDLLSGMFMFHGRAGVSCIGGETGIGICV